jgi:hypothetical protein
MGKSLNSINKKLLYEADFLFEYHDKPMAEKDDEQPDSRNCLVRKVTNNLYECVSGDNYCRNLITFGYGKYCSRLLAGKSGWTGRIIPCNSEIDHEQFD